MSPSPDSDAVSDLLSEQVAYYRARAPEYTETATPEMPVGELRNGRDAAIAALRGMRPSGDVLELAFGPGTWTAEILHSARSVTALDASPEMLALAAAKIEDERARAVKVPHTPTGLQTLLHRIGWRFTVTPLAGPFFWGCGARATEVSRAC